MTLQPILICGAILPALLGCTTDAVQPSPTSDQVMAQQYHAHNPQGAMAGAENQIILDADHNQIAKPAMPAPSSSIAEPGMER